jgi:4-methylaminobutanoate oxidase (formaldehyde-forming)
VRQGEEDFYLVTSTTQGQHDAHWIRRHAPSGSHFSLVDISSSIGVLSVMGPQSTAFLQALTDADLSDSSLGFGRARQIGLGMATVWAVGLSYVGEPGWELHIPIDQMASVYLTLMERAQSAPIQHAGHYAIQSLRIEKGFRAWSAELSPDDNPLQAGLGFAVSWDKKGGFKGREALLNLKETKALDRRLVLFQLEDPDPMLWGGEIILRDGQPVGYTTSAAYGHSVGASVAMGYVRANPDASERVHLTERFLAGNFQLQVGEHLHRAQAHLRPLL